MKRTVLATAFIFAVSIASFARKFVAEGKTYTALGDYRIEIADKPVTLMGRELKAFIISYENSDAEVTVVFDKKRNGMTYYVLSDDLSVKYVCNRRFFGVAKLGKELEKEGYRTSESALNKGEYFHQRVITTGSNCDLENSKLIAAYYPMLTIDNDNKTAIK
jgi:hypothetical protein